MKLVLLGLLLAFVGLTNCQIPKMSVFGIRFIKKWTMIALPQRFNDPVIVCTPIFRGWKLKTQGHFIMRDVTGTHFKIRPSDGKLLFRSKMNGYCIAVEKGVYPKMEAVKYVSTRLDFNKYHGDSRRYANRYNRPIVLGQVMTTNGIPSSFYAKGNGGNNPTAGKLITGRMSCCRPFRLVHNVLRKTRNFFRRIFRKKTIPPPSEVIGYIVVEKGTYHAEGFSFTVGNTPFNVRHYIKTPKGTGVEVHVKNIEGVVLSPASKKSKPCSYPGVVTFSGSRIAVAVDKYRMCIKSSLTGLAGVGIAAGVVGTGAAVLIGGGVAAGVAVAGASTGGIALAGGGAALLGGGVALAGIGAVGGAVVLGAAGIRMLGGLFHKPESLAYLVITTKATCQPNSCHINAVCTSTTGSSPFKCTCKPGWKGDGTHCQSSCEGISCGTNAVCEATVNGPACKCKPGWKGDGTNCQASCEEISCGTNAVCEVTNNRPVCKCKPGWKGDSTNCKASCEGISCGNNAVCEVATAGPEPYMCNCKPGYVRDGDHCRATCDRNTCNANADCTVTPDGPEPYRCTCKSGFNGDGVKNCHRNINFENCIAPLYIVKNGQTNSIIPNSKLRIKSVAGSFSKTFSGSDGIFTMSDIFEDGTYTLTFSAPGYQLNEVTVTIDSNCRKQVTEYPIFLMSVAAELGAVLSWENPCAQDLDIHLLDSNGNHISFLNKNISLPVTKMSLDYDVRSGFGPETISIQYPDPSVRYLIVVFNFDMLCPLSETRAKVTLFTPGKPSTVVYVPTEGNISHNWWVVATIERGDNFSVINKLLQRRRTTRLNFPMFELP